MPPEKKKALLIVNFGGPRDLDEVHPFLSELLTDQDVVQTNFPKFLHNLIFKFVAKRRSRSVKEDYRTIGGKSPIFFDTEKIKEYLQETLNIPIFTFHRYLPETHSNFVQQITKEPFDEILVFPMFPQYTFATTGSIARWMNTHLPNETEKKLQWIKSYHDHPAYIKAQQIKIKKFLEEKKLNQDQTMLFFSAHGLPQKFIKQGDPYKSQCETSYNSVMKAFQKSESHLAYQSQFGRDEWIRPYTADLCKKSEFKKENIVFIPLSFTSDHIETLFEIENDYMPLVKERGFNVHRVPALNFETSWLEAIPKIIQDSTKYQTDSLIRK